MPFLFSMHLGCIKKPPTLPSEKSVYHNNLGVNYMGRGDLERAEFEFLTAIELNSKYAESYNNLGILKKTRGEYDLAEKSFKKAISLNKNYASAHNHLGALYLAQGKLEEALKTTKKALKIEPQSADINFNLGLIWMEKAEKQKKPELKKEAEKNWKRATELNPDLDYVHMQMAEYYREKGDFELAIVRYRLALSVYPKAATWVRLGRLYLEKGAPFKAQNSFQKAIEIDPQAVDGFLQLGVFYLEQKLFDEAIEVFNIITKYNKFEERAHFHLGLVYIEKAADSPRFYKNAIDAFAKAKIANPHYADATYNLGWAYLKSGNRFQARQEWEYTLTISPGHAQALFNMATLSQHQGIRSESINYFCKFLQAEKGNFPAQKEVATLVLNQMGGQCPH